MGFTLEARQAVDYGQPLGVGSIDIPGVRRLSGSLLVVPRADIKQQVISDQGLRPAAPGRSGWPAAQAEVFLGVSQLDASQRIMPGGPVPEGALAYEFSSAWSLRLQIDPLVAQVSTVAATLLRLGHGEIAAETTLTCNILEAGLSVLRVRLPGWAVNSWVDGPGISSRRLDRQTNTWTVILNQRRKGTYPLRVTYDRLIDAGTPLVYHQEPQLLGAVSQKGTILVGKESGEVSISVTTEGHLRVAEDAPAVARAKIPITQILQYSGLGGRDWKLGLAISELSEAAVLKIQATDCLLQTMLGRDGTAVTFMTLTLEKTRQQFAPLQLPDSRQLWGAYVNGRPVKPVVGEEPDGYLIPLSDRGEADGAFELTIVYTEKMNALDEQAVDLEFKTPRIEVPTGSMSWEVYLPAGYHLRPEIGRQTGNMQLLLAPPEASSPITEEMFSPDSSRWRRGWPVVQPYVAYALAGLLGLAGLVVIAALVWVLVRHGFSAAGRVIAPAGRVIRVAWNRPVLRWAAIIAIVIGAGIVLLSVASSGLQMARLASEDAWSKRSRGYGDTRLRKVSMALERYRQLNAYYPESLEVLVEKELVPQTVIDELKAEGAEYHVAGRKAKGLTDTTVVLTTRSEDGFNVLRNDKRIDWVGKKDRKRLAGELYRQGSVDNKIFREDLGRAAGAQDKDRAAKLADTYKKARSLRRRSRGNLDERLKQSEVSRLKGLARETYGWSYDEKDAEADDLSDLRGDLRESAQPPPGYTPQQLRGKSEKALEKALQKQAAEVVRRAQSIAGVKVTDVQASGKPKYKRAELFRTEELPGVWGKGPGARLEPEKNRPADVPATGEKDERGGGWRAWSATDGEQISFGTVTRGRSKGSLPIGLELPSGGTMPYLFGRAFSVGGGDEGTFQVQAARSGAGYTVYGLAGLAVIGLVVTLGQYVVRRRRYGGRIVVGS